MSQSEPNEPRVLARAEHAVSRRNMSQGARKVLYRLHGAGHLAYLVGGSVRDLMLGLRPKDFDVSTDARPGEIRRLFRNSRIIGRRFRLAHVMFHDGVVEVSTFRADPDPGDQRRSPGELLVTNDNTFGTPREDAFRRDFTVNALFYNVADFTVIDYVGGIDDLERRMIRVIGDPHVRFQEDPVRMLRACEFAGRLGFGIEARTQEAIYDLRLELGKAAPARLGEELSELLASRHAGATVQWMLELGLADVMLPEIGRVMAASSRGRGEFSRVLPVIDRLQEEGRELTDVARLGALVLPPLVLERFEAEVSGPLSRNRLRAMAEEAVTDLSSRFALSNQKTQRLLDAIDTFHRLCEMTPEARPAARLVRRSSFSDAVTLFELLVAATGEGEGALAEWQQLAADPKVIEEAPAPRRQRRRRRRRRRRPKRAQS